MSKREPAVVVTSGVGSEWQEHPCAQDGQAALRHVYKEADCCLLDAHHLLHGLGLKNKLPFPTCALAVAIGCFIYMLSYDEPRVS